MPTMPPPFGDIATLLDEGGGAVKSGTVGWDVESLSACAAKLRTCVVKDLTELHNLLDRQRRRRAQRHSERRRQAPYERGSTRAVVAPGEESQSF